MLSSCICGITHRGQKLRAIPVGRRLLEELQRVKRGHRRFPSAIYGALRHYGDSLLNPQSGYGAGASPPSSRMARIARFIVPGLPHHVTQRGNRRERIFFNDYNLCRGLRARARWVRMKPSSRGPAGLIPRGRGDPGIVGRPYVSLHLLSTISCRKSEDRLNLPHEQSCPPVCPRPWEPVPRAPLAGKGREEFYLRKRPRNPLISLDSDERIQGNSRKSNPHKPGPWP
jgi:hypothetical protein